MHLHLQVFEHEHTYRGSATIFLFAFGTSVALGHILLPDRFVRIALIFMVISNYLLMHATSFWSCARRIPDAPGPDITDTEQGDPDRIKNVLDDVPGFLEGDSLTSGQSRTTQPGPADAVVHAVSLKIRAHMMSGTKSVGEFEASDFVRRRT
jgi:hypothetical protein